jgi:hypothetical protein
MVERIVENDECNFEIRRDDDLGLDETQWREPRRG